MTTLESGLVLVTGAAGWLGLRLVEALARGLPEGGMPREPQRDVRVRGLVLDQAPGLPRAVDDSPVEVVTGDLRRPDDCASFCDGARGAVLFHTAGVIHPRRVHEYHDVNVAGTRNLLEAAVRVGVRRAVVVSSNSPFGYNAHRDQVFDEGSPYHPYMNYGRTKMLMERVVQEYQRSGALETVVIRAPWFYGPNQPARQTRFFQLIRDGRAPIVGDGENRRSMAYIDNLCQGLLLAARHAAADGQAYWIADERPYTMNEIVGTVERLLEREFGVRCAHKRLRLPALASEVARIVDGALQSAGFYQQEIHVLSEMSRTIACSVARAQSELGYRPLVALEEGMRRSLQWCARKGLL